MSGGAGPVGMLIVLFIVWGLLTSLLCWGIAWAVARGLSRASPQTRSFITWACFALALFVALAFEPYSTPFGRAAKGGLLQVLS